MTEPEIIQAIHAGGARMEKCVKYVFDHHFGYVRDMIKKFNLYDEEGKEHVLQAYTDAIVVFQRKVRSGDFLGKAKYSTYLYSIFHNKCVDIIRQKTTNKRKFEALLPIEVPDPSAGLLETLEKQEMTRQVTEKMETLPNKCKAVLMDWNDGYSMTEIAERNGLESPTAARNKKYNCLKELVKMMKTLKHRKFAE